MAQVHFARLVDILSERYAATCSSPLFFGLSVGQRDRGAGVAQAVQRVRPDEPQAAGRPFPEERRGHLGGFRPAARGDGGPGADLIALRPTLPELTGPLGHGDFDVLHNKEGIPCDLPCYNLTCDDNRCMKSITPEQVVEAIEKYGWLK